ncbi:hypothetical protein [Rhodococcus sp. NPDC127528]
MYFTPTRTTPGHAATYGGSLSTEEIKARIEAMYAFDGSEPTETTRL